MDKKSERKRDFPVRHGNRTVNKKRVSEGNNREFSP
jgi:hypothetical protein